MSKTELLAELAKLAPEDREEVRVRLAEMDEDDWIDGGTLTNAEKALIEERFQDLEANPGSSIPWSEAKKQLMAKFRR